MLPINLEQFKGLIEINGEKLIERLITQLQEAGISDITVVAGFQKEEYDYLVDRFGVNMKIVQSYNEKNNLDYLFSKEKYPIHIYYLLIYILLAGIFGTLSYLQYYKSIETIGASKAMPLNITYTAWVILFSFIILGEKVGLINILLGAIIYRFNYCSSRS